MSMMGYGLPWTGNRTIQDGSSDLPEDIAEFDVNLVTMKLTDTVRRDSEVLTRDGKLMNKAATTLMTMQKVLNLDSLSNPECLNEFKEKISFYR